MPKISLLQEFLLMKNNNVIPIEKIKSYIKLLFLITESLFNS